MNRATHPIVLSAGLASTCAAQIVPGIGQETHEGPRRMAGHLYINAGTGEAVFTPAEEYAANRAGRAFRTTGDDINNDGVPDYWINTNTDPCPIGTPTDPNFNIAAVDSQTTQGDHHLYKAQLVDGDTDVLVNSVTFTFWTDLEDTDTNLDGVPDGNTAGLGLAISFWDKEDYFGKTSCLCAIHGGPGFTRTKIVTLNIQDLPGAITPLAPGELVGTVITLELAPGQVFEIADTDGAGPASGNFNPFIAAIDTDTNSDTIPDVPCADTDGNGTIDWAFSFQGIQPDDGRSATIGYTLAAPGRFGPAGQFAADGVTPLNPHAGDPTDGLIDYINQTAPPAPLQWSNTRIVRDSIISPMGFGALPFTSALLSVPSIVGRFSLFFASQGSQPDPADSSPNNPLSCPGVPNSDQFGWGGTHPPDGTFYGDLNCVIDDDLDTVPDGRPYTGAFLALSGPIPGPCPVFANCDGNPVLNIDDIDCFVTGFIAGDLSKADCDGSGVLNVDDIDCFVASFLGGCS